MCAHLERLIITTSEQCIRIREIKNGLFENACAASRRLSSDGLRVSASAFSAQPEKPHTTPLEAEAVAATIEVAPHDEETPARRARFLSVQLDVFPLCAE